MKRVKLIKPMTNNKFLNLFNFEQKTGTQSPSSTR